MNNQVNYTKSELANLYGYSYSKFASELRIMDFYKVFPKHKHKNYITPLQLVYIYENIGLPVNNG